MAGQSGAVQDDARGWSKLAKELATLDRAHVVVGIMGPQAEAQHGNSGVTVAEVASYHEFGRGVPERSFLRDTIDMRRQQIDALLLRLTAGVAMGRVSAGQALELIGESTVGMIIERIVDHIPPPNAPSTIKRKGSSTPLIDSAQMKGAISYKVTVGG